MNSLYFYQFYFETKNIDTLNTKKKKCIISTIFSMEIDFFQLSYTIYETIQFYFAKEKKEKIIKQKLHLFMHCILNFK